MKGGTSFRCRSFAFMHSPNFTVVGSSLHIALEYLERSGELGDREAAARLLVGAMENFIRRGERRPLMLANRAIEAYQNRQQEQRAAIRSATDDNSVTPGEPVTTHHGAA